MSKSYKGGDFEREICKKLSRWWTEGERDDIYWRSSQSGGRATERAKKGQATFGSYGDIAVVDPIGMPLLKLFTIELKRGSSHGSPGDLFDSAPTEAIRPFEAALNQAFSSHQAAKSKGWMLIVRRDHKVAMVYLDFLTARLVWENTRGLMAPHCVIYSLRINQPDGYPPKKVKFVAWRLEDFLSRITPTQIINMTS